VHRLPAGVDIVVAGHGEDTARRREVGERPVEELHVAGEVVHLVTGDDEQVGLLVAHGAGDPLQEAAGRVGADVEVGDLDHPQPVVGRGEPGHVHGEAPDDQPAGPGVAEEREDRQLHRRCPRPCSRSLVGDTG